jgi:formylmethanofuran dehydrogenase subunit B
LAGPHQSESVADETAERSVADVLCTHCGCLCDDIQLRLRGRQILAAQRACPAGQRWFFDQSAANTAPPLAPACRIHGQPASLAAGIAEAARLLLAARAPLVYGLTETTCEAQRRAAAIADWLGATLDTPTSAQGPLGLGLQGIGEVIATLGEVTNRGDLIIYWGCDPAVDEPRHFERYTLGRAGMFVPRGRADRTCIVVDHQPSETAAAADQFISLAPGADFAALWTLRALVQSGASATNSKPRPLDPQAVRQATGQPLAVWQELADRMRGARFGAIFYNAQLLSRAGGHWNGEALLALVHDLNAQTRFVTRSLRGPGNRAGADNVLAWQTGYPYAVNLAAGFPRFNPDDYRARAVLERGEVDAALIVASDPLTELPSAAASRLRAMPYVAVDWRMTPTVEHAAVSFTTATYSIHQSGVVYRTDDVPLPVRPILTTELPFDVQILEMLEAQIRQSTN